MAMFKMYSVLTAVRRPLTSAAVTKRAPVLFVCTGNATRSVIAGAALLSRLPDVPVETAGTLVIDGLPPSHRTRSALAAVGLDAPRHRSRQARAADLDAAELVVALAPEHVRWVRREHPSAASRTATLKRLCRDLPPGPAPLAERVAALVLGEVELEPWEEIVDPGGAETDAFVACAHEVVALVDRLARVLAVGSVASATDSTAGTEER
jgi:protein-tyrosine-phosphatase